MSHLTHVLVWQELLRTAVTLLAGGCLYKLGGHIKLEYNKLKDRLNLQKNVVRGPKDWKVNPYWMLHQGKIHREAMMSWYVGGDSPEMVLEEHYSILGTPGVTIYARGLTESTVEYAKGNPPCWLKFSFNRIDNVQGELHFDGLADSLPEEVYLLNPLPRKWLERIPRKLKRKWFPWSSDFR